MVPRFVTVYDIGAASPPDENRVSTTAMIELGNMHKEGLGVEKDVEKAMEYYRRAADLGAPLALNNIGALYEEGLGVEQDYGKAMEYYRQAVDRGCIAALACIGYLYEWGLGVEKNAETALEYYRKAYESGDPTTLEVLESMTEEGEIKLDYKPDPAE